MIAIEKFASSKIFIIIKLKTILLLNNMIIKLKTIEILPLIKLIVVN